MGAKRRRVVLHRPRRPHHPRRPRGRVLVLAQQHADEGIAGDGLLSTLCTRGCGVTGLEGRTFDVGVDGKRFLMIKPGSGDPRQSLIVVENWLEELKRLVPTK